MSVYGQARVGTALALVVLLAACVPAGSTRSDDPALSGLEQQVEAAPDDQLLRLRLAEAYLQRFADGGDRDAALLEASIEQYRRVEAASPGNVQARIGLYRALARRAIVARRRDDIAQLRALYDGTPALLAGPFGPPELVEAMLVLGSAANEREAEPAAALLKEAIRRKPGFHRTHLTLGRLYLALGRRSLAMASLERAASLAEQDPEPHAVLGLAWLERVEGLECRSDDPKAVARGIAALKRAVALAPEVPSLHSGLARLYEISGRSALWLHEARRAASLGEGDWRDSVYVAGALLGNGRHDEAVAAYEAVRAELGDSATDVQIGRVWFIAGRHEEAAASFDRVRARGDLDHPYDWFRRALSAQALGDAAAARATLRDLPPRLLDDDWERGLHRLLLGEVDPQALIAAATDDCQRTEAHFYAGMQRLARGDVEGARQRLRDVLELAVHPYIEHTAAKALLPRLD